MRELLAKRLTEPCRKGLTSHCPCVDLVATVTQRQSVDVWRMNGQRVFGLVPGEDDNYTIDGLAWRSDGRMLAVALSTGIVLLIDSFSGKTAHTLQIRTHSPVNLPNWSSSQQSPTSSRLAAARTSNLFWSSHFANASNTRVQIQNAQPDVALDDLLSLGANVAKLLNVRSSLPRELARIDVESSLPKLSTLPATGAEDDLFSTRNSIDAIFHPQSSTGGQQKSSGDEVDVLLAPVRGCSMHIHTFESFEIGTVDISQALPKGLKGRGIVHHASHPLLSTHFFVLEVEADGHAPHPAKQAKSDLSLHLVGLDLRFIPQTSYNLTLLATKATQLQNLLRYVSQIQSQISQEVRTAFDLPSRFLRNVNESLAEQDSTSSFTTAAYHLVVTGECDPRLKEWLVNEVGDRGLKRWEKAVSDCLDLIRRMLSECLLPAVERCQVVISRLDGLARFSDTAIRLGLDEKGIKSVRETLDVLTILGEDLLRDVCVEMREFAAFMQWLKWEAEVEALEEGSERAEEMRESYNGEGELQTVLDYVSGAMQTSRVHAYIDVGKDAAVAAEGRRWDDSQLHDRYKKARSAPTETQLPKLGELVHELKARSEQVFRGMAEALKKNILSSYIAPLTEPIDTAVMDCRIMHSQAESDAYKLHILAAVDPSRENNIVLYTATVESRKGPKIEGTRVLNVPVAGEILDLKFAGDDAFLVLASSGKDRQLLWHAVGNDEGGTDNWETQYHFPNGLMTGGMRPARLEVNGRTSGRAVTVLDEAGVGFVVLSLD